MSDTFSRLAAALAGRYRLERELGTGGMATVYLAHDLRHERDVAIKVLHSDLGAALGAERFLAEIKTTAKLQHPNILPLLDSGAADDLLYYVMPFVRGETLRARLERGPILHAESLPLLRNILQALQAAHAVGIVHRDIKPENVLLTGGAAIVADFGIAKAVGSAAARAPGNTLTQLGTSLGTPAYMAPEQAAGDPATDHRADLYAWGMLAYETLAGAHPFARHTAPHALMAAHLAESVPPLPSRSGDVPAQVAAIIMQCLAKDPVQRPATADVVLGQFDGQGAPTNATVNAPTAIPLTVSERFARIGTPIKAVAVVLLAIALVVALRYMVRPDIDPTNRTVVVMPFENLGNAADAYLADGVSEEIANELARLPGVKVIGRDGVRGATVSQMRPRELAAALGAQFVLSGTLQWERSGENISGNARVRIVPVLTEASAGERVWSQSYDERLANLFQVQASVAQRVADALSVKLSPAQQATLGQRDRAIPEARDLQLRARALLRQRGQSNLVKAVELFSQAVAIDSTYARAWAGLAEANVLLPTYRDESRAPAEFRAIAARAAARAVQLDSTAPDVLLAAARVETAEFRLTRALALVDRSLRADSNAALTWVLRSELLAALGRQDERSDALDRALALDRLLPLVHNARAQLFLLRDQPDSAVVSAERAVTLAPSEPTWKNNLIAAYAAARRTDDAIRLCRTLTGPSDGCAVLIPALAGDSTRRAAAIELTRRAPRNAPVAILFATVASTLGDRDLAFEWLAIAVDQHDDNLISSLPSLERQLGRDPRWAPVVRRVRGEDAAER